MADTGQAGAVADDAPHALGSEDRGNLQSFTDMAAAASDALSPSPDIIETVECELLPRLMMAYRVSPETTGGAVVTSVDRMGFLNALLTQGPSGIADFLEDLKDRGVPREQIIADLLANAARQLGTLWTEDLCDFTDVTLAMGKLQAVLRRHSVVGSPGYRRGGMDAPSVLLATVQGEQHSFGVLVVAEEFRRDGWHVASEPGTSQEQLLNIVAHEHFDVIGLSVSTEQRLPALKAELRTLRKASANPDVRMLVGGGFLADAPELCRGLAADILVTDAVGAPGECRKLLAHAGVGC